MASSEFFSFMNHKPQQVPSPKRQPSLNTFTSFSPSVSDLPSIITSKDFDANMETYKALVEKAGLFRKSLAQVSESANEFGRALEDCVNKCPKVQNPRAVCDGLINAGGLQYIIGSYQQILSQLIEKSFEEPLKQSLDQLKNDYTASHGFYQQEVKSKSKSLRQKELENIKLSKQRTRNLNTYKHNLMMLTNQLDDIDRLKYDYYHEINAMIEKFNHEQLLLKTGALVRAQLEIYEGIAKKGWSGGGLDDLLAVSPDLFEVSYEEEDTIQDDVSDTIDPEESFSLPMSNSLIRDDGDVLDALDIGESSRNTPEPELHQQEIY